MFRFTVLYGHPKDPAEFDRYYHEIHIPLVEKIKGFSGLTVTKFAPSPQGEQPPYYLMAGLYAKTPEEFGALMATPEGQAATTDIANFATGGVTVLFGEETVTIPFS